MSSNSEYLWYIPNNSNAGHRGDTSVENHYSLETLTRQAKPIEGHGWKGALIGTGWGRPDTFTVAGALDHLTDSHVRVNIVSGKDTLAAYGDSEGNPAQRYARTAEFMRLIRKLWTEESVTFTGERRAPVIAA